MRSRRLSRNARWIAHEPVMLESGFLYFRLDMGRGTDFYVKVRGKQRRYWMDHLLYYTDAHEVTCIN